VAHSIQRFVERVKEAQVELVHDAREQQRQWNYTLHRGRVWFDRETRELHRQFRQSIPSFLREANLLSILTAPFIYGLGIPLVVLDVAVTVYQWICFPVYGIARVPRRRYFQIDRYKLGYLNAIEKANCTYCSYANGLLAYVREIAARTEQYWCPIKHARAIPTPHTHYHLFFDYGDAKSWRKDLPSVRRALEPGSSKK